MNKKLLILPLSLLLVSMTSCGGNNNSTSSSSLLSSIKQSILQADKSPYIIRSSTSISNSQKIISSTYSNYEVNTTTNILHNYGSKAIINSVDSPSGSDSQTKAFNIYYSPSKTYTLGDDGKYSVKDATNTIKVFSISYNFQVLQEVSGTNSSFTSKVLKADTTSFFTKEISDVNSDVSITGSLQTIDSVERLTKLEFTYTTKAMYTCAISINYDYTMPNISLPTL